jgi:hypothetical protein
MPIMGRQCADGVGLGRVVARHTTCNRVSAGNALTTFCCGDSAAPKVIAHKSDSTRSEILVNPAAWSEFLHKAHINDKAAHRCELFKREGPVGSGCVLRFRWPCVTGGCCFEMRGRLAFLDGKDCGGIEGGA